MKSRTWVTTWRMKRMLIPSRTNCLTTTARWEKISFLRSSMWCNFLIKLTIFCCSLLILSKKCIAIFSTISSRKHNRKLWIKKVSQRASILFTCQTSCRDWNYFWLPKNTAFSWLLTRKELICWTSYTVLRRWEQLYLTRRVKTRLI